MAFLGGAAAESRRRRTSAGAPFGNVVAVDTPPRVSTHPFRRFSSAGQAPPGRQSHGGGSVRHTVVFPRNPLLAVAGGIWQGLCNVGQTRVAMAMAIWLLSDRGATCMFLAFFILTLPGALA